MKFKKAFLIFSIILTMLLITAISASDNQTVTENYDSTHDSYFEEINIETNTEEISPSSNSNNNTNENDDKSEDIYEDVNIHPEWGLSNNEISQITPAIITDPYGMGCISIIIESSKYNLNGNITTYEDDKIVNLQTNPNSTKAYSYLEFKSGNHTINIAYSGDEHHKAMNKTFKYINTFYTCGIAHNLLYVEISSAKSGILKVNTDNRNIRNITVTKHKTYNRAGIEYIGDELYIIPLDHLKKGENHTVEVSFKGDDDSFNEIFNFTLTCPIEFYDYPSEYFLEIDSDIMIPFLAPNDLENKVNITVNNKSYDYFKVEDYSSKFILYNVNVSDLKPGNYNMNISYSGDSKYPSNSVSQNFNITTSIFRSWENYNDKISLRLPNDAKGNLTLDYDGYYESVALKDGKAIIVLPFLNCYEKFKAYYIGDDYNVPEYESYPYYDFEIIYDFASKITGAKDITMNYGDSATIKLKCYNTLGDRMDTNRKIKIRIGDKTFTAKTDDNGIVKFKIPNKITPGKYQLTIIYKNGKLDKKQKLTVKTVKITKKITIKQVLNLKKVNVKKSAKKLTLTAKLSNKLKNKKITFKINGKKYTAKTNKNGVAKINIKKTELNKLTVGKKLTYSATYLKNTVKKTVKVKK